MNRVKDDIVIIIPAYNPDEKFIIFLEELVGNGWEYIIVVDDGSKKEANKYFEIAKQKYKCQVVKHAVNLGQGRAFKSAFNYFINKWGEDDKIIGIIECDCDGQHVLEDVNKCAELLRDNPNDFILGVRDFSSKMIPFRSRFGNKVTNAIFSFFCGLEVKDTQTGLKGIPKSFLYKLIEAPGERFEYASSVLLMTKSENIKILQFPINTIYIDGNATSHFKPIIDSVKIYSLIFKYACASLSSFIVDIVIFSLGITFLSRIWCMREYYIFIATYLAKIFSCSYSFIINKKLVFNSKEMIGNCMPKYVLLCIMQATLSGCGVSLFTKIFFWNEVLCKIIVDTVLFFVSFKVQDKWIFGGGKVAYKN